ncbi:pyridoxal-dependent decarboxylase [Fennellomyces sp. T-0311]|nr:pyridoxal-dependent decarboxylase [Fennellomyces sp. T-0311]
MPQSNPIAEEWDSPVCYTSSISKQDIISDIINVSDGDPFHVGDLGDVYRQHLKWKALLPRIEPFYAVKCNPDQHLVKYLSTLGIGFDCASRTEIQQVLDAGVAPNKIIYAHPCKQPSYITYAAQHGVSLMTFDTVGELYKIRQFYPTAEIVLRILPDDSKSQIRLGIKFGAPSDTVPELLETAKKLNLNVVGVSFHVGSGCSDETAFSDAVIRAREVFDQAEALGFHFTLLDVGGGFPGANIQHGITFEKVAQVLGKAVDDLFPKHVRVIAEPGRFYVSSAFISCSQVIGRRALSSTEYMYFINDGMHGSFLCRLLDHDVLNLQVIRKDRKDTYYREFNKTYLSSIWGPTCDPKDCLVKDIRLPLLTFGDWIYQENMGAYGICAASTFNGFQKPKIIYINTYVRSKI